MAVWPTPGQDPWDDDLKAYIDDIALNVSHAARTLSSADPVVPALSNVNEWTVSDAVQVQLPTVNPGAQYTVHVKSGFQNLTWPNGTTVYGETDQQDVWVTLIRGDAGWNVLIPSPVGGAGGGSIDTEWQKIFEALNMGDGSPVQYLTGDASMLNSGWSVLGGTLASVQIARAGSFLLITMPCFVRTGEPGGSSFFSFDNPGVLADYPLVLDAAKIDEQPSVATYQLSAHSLEARCTIMATWQPTEGDATTTEDPFAGYIGPVAPNRVIAFPIDPSSPWGT